MMTVEIPPSAVIGWILLACAAALFLVGWICEYASGRHHNPAARAVAEFRRRQ